MLLLTSDNTDRTDLLHEVGLLHAPGQQRGAHAVPQLADEVPVPRRAHHRDPQLRRARGVGPRGGPGRLDRGCQAVVKNSAGLYGKSWQESPPPPTTRSGSS